MDLLRHNQLQLRRLCGLSSLVFGLLHVASSFLPLFDASPILVPEANSLGLRWDIFHFIHIARHGYVYEHEWAFLPSAPWLIRYYFTFFAWLGCPVVVSRFVLAVGLCMLASETVQTLYMLSLHVFLPQSWALVASILAIIPSSPVTLLFVPYNEPFFTFLSYRGMLACSLHDWTGASLLFALATTFRSNGVLLSGFVIWGLIIDPYLNRETIKISSLIKCISLVALIICPFVAYQLAAYMAFCSGDASTNANWCSNFVPSIYTHVQSTYWNIGFLRYWTLSQIPNFLIAAPPIIVILTFAIVQFLSFLSGEELHLDTLTPHAIHATVFTFVLLFASHTQIILRLAASMPFTYWAASWFYLQNPTLGKVWVYWSVLWGLISVILWGSFLPPA